MNNPTLARESAFRADAIALMPNVQMLDDEPTSMLEVDDLGSPSYLADALAGTRGQLTLSRLPRQLGAAAAKELLVAELDAPARARRRTTGIRREGALLHLATHALLSERFAPRLGFFIDIFSDGERFGNRAAVSSIEIVDVFEKRGGDARALFLFESPRGGLLA